MAYFISVKCFNLKRWSEYKQQLFYTHEVFNSPFYAFIWNRVTCMTRKGNNIFHKMFNSRGIFIFGLFTIYISNQNSGPILLGGHTLFGITYQKSYFIALVLPINREIELCMRMRISMLNFWPTLRGLISFK